MQTRVPPIKTQGIKTKLVPFIREAIERSEDMRWVEPFMGSGVVGFNIRPKRALMCDANPHLVNFYQAIQNGEVTPETARDFLEIEGHNLLNRGEEHYYEIRARFNEQPNPHDFLFLNRSCFNGMIRFNKKGGFNVPFCRKSDRFRPAYITKIVNQIDWVGAVIAQNEFEFRTQDWRATLSQSDGNDYVYLDPPYVGRTTDYHGGWSSTDDEDLVEYLKLRTGSFALSTWLENRHRRNSYVDDNFADYLIKTSEHFYHLGASEKLRNAITEALIINLPKAEATPSKLQAA